MGDPHNQASYSVPVENASPGFDNVNLVATSEGEVPSSNPNIVRGDSSPLPGSHPLNSIRSRVMGAPLSPLQARGTDVITIPGHGTDTLDAMSHIGLVRHGRDGWELVGDASPQGAQGTEEKKTPDQQQQEQQDTADRVPLVEEVETMNAGLLETFGEDVAMGLVEAVATNRPQLIDKLVHGFGGEPGELAAQVREVHARYEDQARQIVGANEDTWQRFSAWCDANASQERAQVARDVYLSQSSKSLKALFGRFESEGAGTYSEEQLASADFGGDDVKAWYDRNTRKAMIRLADGQVMPVKQAMALFGWKVGRSR